MKAGAAKENNYKEDFAQRSQQLKSMLNMS
jgi:hypothetical protein